ncbi:MAG: MFS transporter [Proteobacteria bacterium]|nr:MFS transporter [Pseudomonadota bacterium]
MKAETTDPGSNQTFAYTFLLFCIFTTGIGQSMVFAILQPLGREIGLVEMQIGFIITCSSLVFTVTSPIWGRICDKKGRKPVLLVGQIGYTIGTLFFATAFLAGLNGWMSGLAVYVLIVLARMFQASVMSATPPSAGAYIADITSREKRTIGLGRMGAARNLGTILGPAFGGLIAAVHLLAPLYSAAVVTLISAVLMAFLLEESPTRTSVDRIDVKLKLLDKRYLRLVVIGITMFIGISMVNQTIGFYLQDKFDLTGQRTAQMVGIGMMLSGVASLFSQGFLVQFLRWTPYRLVKVGLPTILLGFVCLVVFNDLVPIVASMAFTGLGTGMVMPGISAGASLAVGSHEQGAVAGIVGICPSAGFTLGPIIGTALYQLDPKYPYMAISLLFIPLILFSWSLKQPKENPPTPDHS